MAKHYAALKRLGPTTSLLIYSTSVPDAVPIRTQELWSWQQRKVVISLNSDSPQQNSSNPSTGPSLVAINSELLVQLSLAG